MTPDDPVIFTPAEAPPADSPPPDAPPPAKPKPQIQRMRIGLNVSLQFLLGLVLFGLVNYLACRNFTQWDYTFNKNFTLSGSTVDYLKKLTIPIKITALTRRGTAPEKDISTLLEQFRKHLKGKVEVSIIDTSRDVQAWEAFRARHYQSKLKLESNGILIEANAPGGGPEGGTGAGGQRWIAEDALYETDQQTKTVTRFKGEALLNSAIMGVTSVDRPRMGIVSGRGNWRKLPDGHTVFDNLQDIAAKHNFQYEPFPILSDSEVPKSYSGLIWIAPLDIGDRERDILKAYFETPGRSMLIMLNPENSTPKLDQFLAEYGIQPQPDRVLKAYSTSSGPRPRFDVEARFLDGSALTTGIVSQGALFLGFSRSLKILTGTEKQRMENIETTPLLSPSQDYWGDLDFNEPYPQMTEGKDNKPPLYIAAAAERGAARDPRVQMQSSRLVVFGNSMFADPDAIDEVNYNFLTRSLNWMLHRDVVAPNDSETDKLKSTFRIQIKPDQWQRILWMTTGILPLSALMLGLMLWSARRN